MSPVSWCHCLENPNAGNCPAVEGFRGPSQMRINTRSSLLATQQSRTFLGRLQPGPSSSVNNKKRPSLAYPQPLSSRPSDQELPLGTLKGTSGCSARLSLDLCTRCSEGSSRGSVLCDLGRAARRKYRDDDRDFIQYLKLTSD